ncbi:MAG TPA: pyridoxamine 5'-phosphate oxidase family protein [Candidatus Acidoferrales bacterium]|nr:pyridoxamine 5'-phosphate oxidase family protein [Candidatus Acidoferrales bacterium]
MISRSELLEFMRANPLATVATVSHEGAPAAALVGVAVSDQLELVFDTVDTSRKFRNVQRSPRVAVVFGAAGAYESGNHDERTVQYEGIADVPSGEELKRIQEEIYLKQFPDGRDRLKWAHITYVRVRPVWMRYSNYNVGPPEIAELGGAELTKFITV